ncbi:MAG: DUF86 domain-containing protein [Cyclobacteriaceae bacterium]
MTEAGRKYLSDILMAIELIEEFIQDTTAFPAYEADLKTQSAVERQLGIIGEALNKFHKVEPAIRIENDRQIVAFRNRLIHAYDSIDNAIVWVILKKHLPNLKSEVVNIEK